MKETILQLQSQGWNRDCIYQILASKLGLFGVAFFGHKGTKSDKAKLNYRWKLILKTCK